MLFVGAAAIVRGAVGVRPSAGPAMSMARRSDALHKHSSRHASQTDARPRSCLPCSDN